MDVPDSPDQLLGRISEHSIRDFFPDYDEFPPGCQKLAHILHGEFLQGELSYNGVTSYLVTVMLIWKKLSSNAHLQQRAKHVSPKGETTVYYLNEVAHYGRMAQYLDDLFMLIMQRPKFQDGEDRFFES